MYEITEVTIENDVIKARVILTMKDGMKIEVTVPVKTPKTKEDVIAAIDYRESQEVAKYNAAPTLMTIKSELEKLSIFKSAEIKE